VGPIGFGCSAPVVSAVRISFSDLHVSIGTDFRDGAVILRRDGVSGVDDSRRVGVRDIQLVRGGRKSGASAITHEGDGPPVVRKIEGELGFRAETGHDLIGWNSKRTNMLAVSREIIEENGR